MNAAMIIERLHDAALKCKDDATSNVISKLAGRLAHQGALFEKPLNEAEIILISKYSGIKL